MDTALANTATWFKKADNTASILQANFNSIVATSEKYQPSIKFQINKDTQAFLSKTEPIPIINTDSIPKKSKVTVVGHMASVYIIANKTFGISNKASHIMVLPPKAEASPPAFVADSDDDNDDDGSNSDC